MKTVHKAICVITQVSTVELVKDAIVVAVELLTDSFVTESQSCGTVSLLFQMQGLFKY